MTEQANLGTVDNLAANDINTDDFVPLQCKPFAGKYSRYVISPEVASEQFSEVHLLLHALNGIFDTNISISYPGVQMTLGHLISEGHDLGAIYARMQAIWPTLSVPLKSSKPLPNDNSDVSDHASKKCRDIHELLNLLNRNFKTNISMDHSGVKEVLGCLISQGCELGDICTIVTSTWPRTPEQEKEWARVWGGERMNIWEDFLILKERGEGYESSRQESLRHDNTIVKPYLIKPRRLWDLYAHRVIPFQFSLVDADHLNDKFRLPEARRWSQQRWHPPSAVPARLYRRFRPTDSMHKGYRYHAVSHSWTKDMSGVDSPVNAREWPVPLPGGVTLEAVRTELLNLGAQYVWLDVVCLRQKSLASHLEALRTQEWMIDVPTIGWVYTESHYNAHMIRYFNGLGKVFRGSGWRDERHWSQRAWTVQEIGWGYIDAGRPQGVENLLKETNENGTKLLDHLKIYESELGVGLHRAVPVMKGRYSQDPVDKVLGLSALLRCDPQIACLKNETPEYAWARLVRHGSYSVITQLLLYCSLPGENGCYWRPSWRQLMEGTRVVEEPAVGWTHLDSVVDGSGCASCTMVLIERCEVLAPNEPVTVLIKAIRDVKTYEWPMTDRYAHGQEIAPGEYTLAGISPTWILCRKHLDGKLEKVCVLIEPSVYVSYQTGFWDLMELSPRKNIIFV